MVNKFLFLAYSFVWLVFTLYAWSLSRREDRLRKEIEELRARLEEKAPPGPGTS